MGCNPGERKCCVLNIYDSVGRSYFCDHDNTTCNSLFICTRFPDNPYKINNSTIITTCGVYYFPDETKIKYGFGDRTTDLLCAKGTWIRDD